MKTIVLELQYVPDLTLAKYSSQSVSGVKGVLDAHVQFLRLFCNKPGISLHLMYRYDPEASDGEKLSCFLLLCDTSDEDTSILENAIRLVSASPLAPFFKFIPHPKEFGGAREAFATGVSAQVLDTDAMVVDPMRYSFVGKRAVKWCASLGKSAILLAPSGSSQQEAFCVLPEYQPSENGRLLSMFQLMDNLGSSANSSPIVYRVDLYQSGRSTTLRQSLPLNAIKMLRYDRNNNRQYFYEGIEQSYERALKSIEESPVFAMNVFCFASDEETARSVLNAAAAEAIRKGNVSIALFSGQFNSLSFLSGSRWSHVGHSIDGSTQLIPRVENGDPYPGYSHVNSRAASYAYRDAQSIFTLEEAACFFRLPTLNDGETIQLRKETAPQIMDKEASLLLGQDNTGQKAYFPLRLLNKHAFISGVPGSGKTNSMHHIATSLINAGIPLLVLEPAKHEYRALLNMPKHNEIRLFSPGGDGSFPLRINPFQIPYGISVSHHIGRLCNVFQGAFPLEGALPFILDRSIEAIYAKHGWLPKMKSTPSKDKQWPTLTELYEQMEKELDKESYGGEVKGNLTSALRMRIGGLLRRELGELFDTPYSTYAPNLWTEMTAVIELEALDKSAANFLTLLLLVLIRESLMVASPPSKGQLKHVIFVEEAHNLIGPEAQQVSGEDADPKKAATAFLSDMLREVRAYGEGIIIADQLPSAIAPEVLKNTGLKIALRMTAADDRNLLGSTMSANRVQLERMAVASPGQALVLYEGLQRPFELMMTRWLCTPDSAINPEELAAISEPLSNSELVSKLIDDEADWYQNLRKIVPNIDFNSVERAYSKLRDAGQQAKEELRKAAALKSGHHSQSDIDYDRAALAALRANGIPSFDSLLFQYLELKSKLDSYAMGWGYMSMPHFSGEELPQLKILHDLQNVEWIESLVLFTYFNWSNNIYEELAWIYELAWSQLTEFKFSGSSEAFRVSSKCRSYSKTLRSYKLDIMKRSENVRRQ